MIETGKVAAILLAAGQSLRFGTADKLFAPIDGEPLLVHAARRLVELKPARLIAVCGDAQGAAAILLTPLGFEIVVNPNPERGLSSSLACGIEKARDGAAEAALICLADMPFVTLRHLEALLARFDPAHAPIVASGRGGIAMPPALFARSLFDQLAQAEGDRGGRTLLRSASLVEAPASELVDIDLPKDLPG
jgi:molybdenum cofactor cytidylyltransferase